MGYLISPLELSDAVQDALKEASQSIKDKINEEAKEIANDVCNSLKRKSPEDTGAYKNSWTVREEEGRTYSGTVNYVVHSKKHYRLTHLLEYGHANRKGGRTPAYPHIAKVNDAACREFERRVVDIINGT